MMPVLSKLEKKYNNNETKQKQTNNNNDNNKINKKKYSMIRTFVKVTCIFSEPGWMAIYLGSRCLTEKQ